MKNNIKFRNKLSILFLIIFSLSRCNNLSPKKNMLFDSGNTPSYDYSIFEYQGQKISPSNIESSNNTESTNQKKLLLKNNLYYKKAITEIIQGLNTYPIVIPYVVTSLIISLCFSPSDNVYLLSNDIYTKRIFPLEGTNDWIEFTNKKFKITKPTICPILRNNLGNLLFFNNLPQIKSLNLDQSYSSYSKIVPFSKSEKFIISFFIKSKETNDKIKYMFLSDSNSIYPLIFQFKNQNDLINNKNQNLFLLMDLTYENYSIDFMEGISGSLLAIINSNLTNKRKIIVMYNFRDLNNTILI